MEAAIFDLDYSVYKDLVDTLDLNDSWEELARRVGEPIFTTPKVILIKNRCRGSGKSATEEMFMSWMHCGPTIGTLRTHLLEMRHARALKILDSQGRNILNGDQARSGDSTARIERNESESQRKATPVNSSGLPLPPVEDYPHEDVQSWSSGYQPGGYWNNRPDITKANFTAEQVVPIHRHEGLTNGARIKTSLNLGPFSPPPPYPETPSPRPLQMSDKHTSQMTTSRQSPYSGEDERYSENGRVSSTHTTPGVMNTRRTPHGASNHVPYDVMSTVAQAVTHNVTEFSYRDIEHITQNFCKRIGAGRFGQTFIAELSKQLCAVKVIDSRSCQFSLDTLLRTLLNCNSIRHRNIVTLLGYSNDGPSVCLIYELMVNGSLYDQLHSPRRRGVLSWMHRIRILRDVAEGLMYLHNFNNKTQRQTVIHANIKSTNVLLGPGFEAKISDFALTAVALSESKASDPNDARLCGANGYLPPYCVNGQRHTTSNDTHGYGIIIFEVCTGLKAVDRDRKSSPYILDFVNRFRCTDGLTQLKLRDRMVSDWPEELWLKLLTVGLLCTPASEKEVPTMKQVRHALMKIYQMSVEVQQQQYDTEQETQSKGLMKDVVYTPDQLPLGVYAPNHSVQHSHDMRRLSLSESDLSESPAQRNYRRLAEQSSEERRSCDGADAQRLISELNDSDLSLNKSFNEPDSSRRSSLESCDPVHGLFDDLRTYPGPEPGDDKSVCSENDNNDVTNEHNDVTSANTFPSSVNNLPTNAARGYEHGYLGYTHAVDHYSKKTLPPVDHDIEIVHDMKNMAKKPLFDD